MVKESISQVEVVNQMDYVITLFIIVICSFLLLRTSSFVRYVKYLSCVLHIHILRRFKKKRFDNYSSPSKHDPQLYYLPSLKEYALESPCPDTHLSDAKDEIFFYGLNSKSEHLVLSISRLGEQKAEAFLHLKLATGRSYQLERTVDYEQSSSERKTFSCGGLQLHYTCPMRRWRLFYNGLLRENDATSGESKIVYVKFALKWRASADVFDFSQDIHPRLFAKSVIKSGWQSSASALNSVERAMDSFSQPGVIHGLITVNSELQEYEVYMFGQRLRNLGNNQELAGTEVKHIMGFVPQNGVYIHLGVLSGGKLLDNLWFGYMVQSDTIMEHISKVVDSETICTYTNTNSFEVDFVADRSYKFKVSIRDSLLKYESTDFARTLNCIKFSIDGKLGAGFQLDLKTNRTFEKRNINIPVQAPFYEEMIPLTVPFTDKICQIPMVSGGKGSSLSSLTYLSKEKQTFVVPEGIVVTTASFKLMMNEGIESKVEVLEDILYGKTSGDLKQACDRVSLEITDAECPNNVVTSITKSLRNMFGDETETIKFAVRSSATSEDTEQMSAAGQMDTFLGVSGSDQVILAVKKCWASQFGFLAVQYKRRYGQCINSPMAVVIQKMVPCDMAGVLFTCHPVTGNPTVLTINANYGLGESVVSHSHEPDTVVLSRDIDDRITIKTVTVGAKQQKTIMKDGEGTEEALTSVAERSTCCLNEEKALRLSRLAIQIENYCHSSRDIEWGFYKEDLYIFQSRPVTSGSSDTDFEILHEFDGSLRVENDFLSISNVGEILPGSVSPLGMDAFCNIFSILNQVDHTGKLPYDRKYYVYGYLMWSNHIFINIADMFQTYKGKESHILSQAGVIAFFGRILDDDDLVAVLQERYGHIKAETLRSIWLIGKALFCSSKFLKRCLEHFKDFSLPVDKYQKSTELFPVLVERAVELFMAAECHIICSRASAFWNIFMFSALGRAEGKYDDAVYGDFAVLLKTSFDVESADVPAAIQNLCYHISQSIKPELFKSMNTQEALDWLINSPSTAGREFKEFLEKHGHRCYQEFDIYSKTWEEDPISLVKLLQNICGNVSEDLHEAKVDDVDAILSKLKVPLPNLSKFAVKFLMPRCRKNVQLRECSKSLVVKAVNAFRKGYRRLGKLMVAEGRIPDEDILYFMTLEDIRELLETRSPKVLIRANHRRRLFPEMNQYIFPEIVKGIPRPISESEPETPVDEYFSMKGFPVSQGIARGKLRVAMSLEDADHIQPGEILLTRCTDIGWTPYFPILAGVVTELGGLISHGAVVSREYGIPCIAGLHGATRKLHTGEYVLLDGNKGILQRLKPPES